VSLLGIFAAGAIAVPLCTAHPLKEMQYVIGNSTPSTLLATQKFRARAEELVAPELLTQVEEFAPGRTETVEVKLVDNDWAETQRGALIIYTSGTTNLPKGVVSTHSGLGAQANSLIEAWKMSSNDYLLHVLPLHHVHGIVNATLAPLMSGGTVEYLFPFSPAAVWPRLVAGVAPPHEKRREQITLFMAVPTIYNRLITSLPTQPVEIRDSAATAIQSLRLAISGSAALPGSIRDDWRALAGTTEGGGKILERYGMTEIGMALSNTLEKRVDNAVGWPLPGVEARLVDVETGDVITKPNVSGEIQIRGPTVFKEYWNKPEATAAEFAEGRWFKTGDVAVRDEDGCYFIQGRRSVDIIKSGGEKVSALEVERELLELPQVAETAVVAVPDPDWGQRVAAVVVLTEQGEKEGWNLAKMREEMKKRVAGYKVPTVMRVVKAIERNQMGKSKWTSCPMTGWDMC
jgi:malonyl-CoA/methylmalonyl-CoA synthetase